MKEFHKIVSVHPLILYSDDLLDFEKILRTSLSLKQQDLELRISQEHTDINGNSFSELLAQSLSKQIDTLSIHAYGRPNGIEITKSISFTFYYNYVDYQIRGDDETWFLGMILQLDRFFAKRKPWYSFLNRSEPVWIAGLIVISLYVARALVSLILKQDFILFFSMLVPFLLGVTIPILAFKQVIFPYVRIYAYIKGEAKINYELLNLIVAIGALLVGVAGIVISVLFR
jgi:hypothetical protein